MPSVVTANHLNEIKVFLNIPIEKFKLRNPLQGYVTVDSYSIEELTFFAADFFNSLFQFQFQTFRFVPKSTGQFECVQSTSSRCSAHSIRSLINAGGIGQAFPFTSQLDQANRIN